MKDRFVITFGIAVFVMIAFATTGSGRSGLPPVIPNVDTLGYSNVFSGAEYVFDDGIYRLRLEPDHTIRNSDSSLFGWWIVDGDTLFVIESHDFEEIDRIDRMIDSIMPGGFYTKEIAGTYRYLTKSYNKTIYPYPGNVNVFIGNKNGDVLDAIFDEGRIYGVVWDTYKPSRNHQIRELSSESASDDEFRLMGVRTSRRAAMSRARYDNFISRRNIETGGFEPPRLSWSPEETQWPIGIFEIQKVNRLDTLVSDISAMKDDLYYNVMNPTVFRYPLPEPWLSLAEEFIENAIQGKYERLALFPADSVSTVTVPLSDLRDKVLTTDFMDREARGYFVALPLDSLEKNEYELMPGNTFPVFPEYPSYETDFHFKWKGRETPPSIILTPEL